MDRVLKSTFNPSEPGQGMARLLRSSTDGTNPSMISAIKSTDAANIETILRDSAADARATQLASSTPTIVVPAAITTRPDAIDAADRANNLTQSVIGVKEGATEAVTAKVGARVTDTVLRTSDGTDYKSVDQYELFQLINAVMQAADRPRVREVRQQMVDTVATKFNFQQRFSDNVAVLRARIARLAATPC